MNDNYSNLSPEEKKKRDEDLYQKFIILGIVPLFIYLMWPLLFGNNTVEAEAQVVENRVEKIEEVVEERPNIDESTLLREETKVAPVVPPKTKRTPPKKTNKIQPGTIKKQPVRPNNNAGFSLTYNPGDKIEHIVQGMGWKGTVQSKQNGNYTVRITEVVTANAQQQFITGNNACFGGKPIGKNAANQVITIPGSCIHVKTK